jgi:RimJ/RimL family protein N-acetyltransferase
MNLDRPSGLTGDQILLRALVSADQETLRSFVNDPEVMRFSNTFHPIGDGEQARWFESIGRASDSVWFGIVDARESTNKLIGTCCLVGMDPIVRLAELRIRIGDKTVWGHGLGTEATRLLVRYGFNDLNLDRIWLRVYASNERAIKLYGHLGFQVEGTWRQAARVDGHPEDIVLMGLLRVEWLNTGSNLLKAAYS